MGSNMAEAHPVGFQWVIEAKTRGAQVIHIDPRFTRTSAVADRHVPLRAGSDIAFLGGVINYILSNDLDFREYVTAYTNAPFLVGEDYCDAEDLDGLFSGYDRASASYDPATWRYQPGDHADPTLQHPRCVYQILKRHYARYTPEMVERVCGVPAQSFLQVARAWTENSGRERTTALVYSVGWTQHSMGAQFIRAGSIIQLLLGNIGRPGGGIFALRGHASIQGSTDVPTLFNLLPGYLDMPHAGQATLSDYLDNIKSRNQKGFWHNADAYMVSLLKEYWGEHATADNDYCFDYLPRINGDHSTYRTVMDMIDGKVFGYFLLGQNPAVGSAHGRMQRLGMANLDWLVVRDLVMIESATFWKEAPEVETGEISPQTCRTEVFFFPAASHVEKAGTFTQTQRMLQWREKAVDPPGDARSELWFFYHLGRKLREKLSGSTDERDRPLLQLAWDYATEGDEPSGEDVLRHMNGIDLGSGRTIDGYPSLKADGSTACGCWIYSGVYADEVNQAARRKPRDEQRPYENEWGWTWPLNRRVLYNRASADPQGRPWSERKKLVWWDAELGEWTGHDVPDFEKHKPPDYRPPEGAVGVQALRGDDAFVMQADGKGWLFAPSGLADGPLPTHYEPHESPVRNALYAQQGNPTRIVFGRKDNPSNPSPPEAHGEVFPFVFTAARLTEHHTAGGMSRQLPYLTELQPALFMEVSPELARMRGLTHMDWAHVITSRTAVDARVFVTDRMRPLRIEDHVVQQVWMPYHWGYTGLVEGDVVNDLLGVVLDPNVFIQESKVATCDVQPGRRPRGPALLDYIAEYRRRAGITTETGTHLDTTRDDGIAHPDPEESP
ncbi:Formate dehydrogenase-O major subunit precursor [Mycobacterium marinum]|nr:Formate dehydrogenase-O major subunit precursor [Mycobacterium marinum]CDM79192.1 formate dehydrogenase, beta subunit, selenocysteine-containing [Mycobacterium marinum E11]AXN52561.1 Formate dehydrogenase-O major subunit precursor [Mycobacterium marinum]RFZ09288.1 Formate dehydrogenase-O major subunit precursor [Mycobacterium marinum]RFZ13067.1 Formate dehydrogenase-O major subunit precursor [Mycobacterium marinum]